MDICAAMRRSSLESESGVFGQRGEAATLLPAIAVSSASRSEAVRVQSGRCAVISIGGTPRSNRGRNGGGWKRSAAGRGRRSGRSGRSARRTLRSRPTARGAERGSQFARRSLAARGPPRPPRRPAGTGHRTASRVSRQQDRIRTEGADRGRHPDDQEAEIAVGEVDVGSEQVDRALAAGNGKRQVPHGRRKMNIAVGSTALS